MKVLVSGADGFIGKNLCIHLKEIGITVLKYTHESNPKDLINLVGNVDFIFHLAGVNRPKEDAEFIDGNAGLTIKLCDAIRSCKRVIPLIFSSSIQADIDNPYGVSKLLAEDALVSLEKDTGSPVYIYRLPNVFGKWSKPNYNSVVATFCHNIANDLPIQINDASSSMHLVFIDDVIKSFLKIFQDRPIGLNRLEVMPQYTITVGELADQLMRFKKSRESMISEEVGIGLVGALYSTYLSFFKSEQFSYKLITHTDSRGRFVEMLKTKNSGQFSFFTAHPGVIRGGHYHHSKNEKFLVVQGNAKFGFRHLITNESYEKYSNSLDPEVVETIPGWAHDITNIGSEELIVLLWTNEIFDPRHPDTFTHKV
jgi:UDP-2-acetamido-2,6-beta-L-arabino-hexul-4-ose reductase